MMSVQVPTKHQENLKKTNESDNKRLALHMQLCFTTSSASAPGGLTDRVCSSMFLEPSAFSDRC